MSMDLTKKTFSAQSDYLIAGTAGIVATAKKAAAVLKRDVPVVLGSSNKLAAVTVNGSTRSYKIEATSPYGIFAEDVKSGEQGVVYLNDEFSTDTLVLSANGSAADLEVPFRAPGIFLK